MNKVDRILTFIDDALRGDKKKIAILLVLIVDFLASMLMLSVCIKLAPILIIALFMLSFLSVITLFVFAIVYELFD